jgi:hypothetical protein
MPGRFSFDEEKDEPIVDVIYSCWDYDLNGVYSGATLSRSRRTGLFTVSKTTQEPREHSHTLTFRQLMELVLSRRDPEDSYIQNEQLGVEEVYLWILWNQEELMNPKWIPKRTS